MSFVWPDLKLRAWSQHAEHRAFVKGMLLDRIAVMNDEGGDKDMLRRDFLRRSRRLASRRRWR